MLLTLLVLSAAGNSSVYDGLLAGRWLFGIPRSVIFLILSFSSRALFILSNYFCIVRYCLSDAAVLAASVFLVLVGLRARFGAKVHSSACF